MNILQALAEGKPTASTTVSIDPSIETFVNESTIPMDILIESVYLDLDITMQQAYETYEMASIVGIAEALQKETNVQEAVSVVMENAVTNLFGKIIEQLKRFKDWFFGIIRKLVTKITGSTDNASSNLKEAARKLDPASGIRYTGHYYNPDGKKFMESVINAADEIYENMDKELAKAESIIAKGEYNKAVSKDGPVTIIGASKQGAAIDICKKLNIKYEDDPTSALIKEAKKRTGLAPDNKVNDEATPELIGRMSNDIRDTTDIIRTATKRLSKVEAVTKSMTKRLEKIQDIVKSKGNDPSVKMLSMDCMEIVNVVRNTGLVESQTINAIVNACGTIHNEYDELCNKVSDKYDNKKEDASMDSVSMDMSGVISYLV